MRNSFTGKISLLWQNLENWLIILFLATFTLNIRKVFLTPYPNSCEEFNEYLTLSFSWADLLILAVIIIYAIKVLYSQLSKSNNQESQSYNVIRNKSSVLRRSTSVSRETLVFLLFLSWILISVFWSQLKLIAFFRSLTFIEISLFAFVAIRSLKRQKWLELAFLALIANGLFQSILSIAQFIRNKSIGIHWLGESILGPNINGVAKIMVEGEKHIRAYGTFPHSNILAGFLIIPIFIISSEILRRFQNSKGNSKNVPRGTFVCFVPAWLMMVFFLITAAGFALTFSRSAFLGLAIGLMILCFYLWKSFSKKFSLILALLIFLVILAGGYLAFHNKDLVSIFSTQSLGERNLYQNVARETIYAHPIIGVGIGQFVYDEFQNYPNFESWQYQPVHNVYLLVFSELGIVGLIFFLLWFFSIFGWGSIENRNTGLLLTYKSIYCIIICYLIILLFDHYFWDIKIGMITFALPIIFMSLATKKRTA